MASKGLKKLPLSLLGIKEAIKWNWVQKDSHCKSIYNQACLLKDLFVPVTSHQSLNSMTLPEFHLKKVSGIFSQIVFSWLKPNYTHWIKGMST